MADPIQFYGTDNSTPSATKVETTKIDAADHANVDTTVTDLSKRTAATGEQATGYRDALEGRLFQAELLSHGDHYKTMDGGQLRFLTLGTKGERVELPAGRFGEQDYGRTFVRVRATQNANGTYSYGVEEVGPPETKPDVKPSTPPLPEENFVGQQILDRRVQETFTDGMGGTLPLVVDDGSGHFIPNATIPSTDTALVREARAAVVYKHAKDTFGLDDNGAKAFLVDFDRRHAKDADGGLAALHEMVDKYNKPVPAAGALDPDKAARDHAKGEVAKYKTAEALARSKVEGSGHEKDFDAQWKARYGKVDPKDQWQHVLGLNTSSPEEYWKETFGSASGEALVARDELPSSFSDKRKDEILGALGPKVDENDRQIVDAQTRLADANDELDALLATPLDKRNDPDELKPFEQKRLAIEARLAQADGDLKSAAERRVALRQRVLDGFATGDAAAIKEATGGSVQLSDTEAKKLKHAHEVATESDKPGAGDKWLQRTSSGMGILAQGTEAGVGIAGFFNQKNATAMQTHAQLEQARIGARAQVDQVKEQARSQISATRRMSVGQLLDQVTQTFLNERAERSARNGKALAEGGARPSQEGSGALNGPDPQGRTLRDRRNAQATSDAQRLQALRQIRKDKEKET